MDVELAVKFSSKNMTNKPRILLIDIETAPILAYVWKIWDENIGLNQIRSHTHLLSYAAKWLDSNEIFYEDQSTRRDIEDDTQLLKSIWKLLDEADIVIVQNGVAFDIPTIKARMMAKGIPPPSPFRTIDTLTQAKKNFRFTSNKLEYLAEIMGCRIRKDKHREFPGFELWRECLVRNPRAWEKMRKYNIDDVLVLQDVYLKMRPWIESHPNVGIFVDSERPLCPKCGRGGLMRRGVRFTNSGSYLQYCCSHCRGYSKSRTLQASNRKAYLSN